MTVELSGGRELALLFDQFPQAARSRLLERIRGLTAELEERVRAAAPVRTGRLRTEIDSRVFNDSAERIAGYVSVVSRVGPSEYAKAATLEYGSDKARRILEGTSSRRAERRLTMPTHIAAYRYLRGPFQQMSAEITAALEQTLAEAAGESA